VWEIDAGVGSKKMDLWLKKCVMTLCVILTGCAGIACKSRLPPAVNSHHDEATILIKDESGQRMFEGRTPTTISLSAGEAYFHPKKYFITFSKEGYGGRTTEVKADISGWYSGNIVFGGLIGLLIVDPLTGKMWKLPQDATMFLTEKVALRDGGEKMLRIVSLGQIPERYKKRLLRLN